MNKYHESLDVAINLIKEEIIRYEDMKSLYNAPSNGLLKVTQLINHRQECITRLSELQNSLDKIAQLKQSLKELDLEKSK